MKDYFAHPTCCIDEPVTIGPGTRVWHYCHVITGATIGRDCVIGQGCFIAGTVRIGDRCKIQNHVSLYDGVVLEDEVFCGPSMVFTNVINPRSAVNRRGEFQTTRVGRGATIGANATVLCGITLGAHCFIAAGAVVTKDVPDYGLIIGVPGRLSGWMSRHGQRLAFDDRGFATCPVTGERYRVAGDGRVELV